MLEILVVIMYIRLEMIVYRYDERSVEFTSPLRARDNATVPDLFPAEIRAEISSQFHLSEIVPFIRNSS